MFLVYSDLKPPKKKILFITTVKDISSEFESPPLPPSTSTQLKLPKKPKKKNLFMLYHMNKNDTDKEALINKKVKNKSYSSGRWTLDEHEKFIDGVIKYGNNWSLVQEYIGTRTCTQTRSHAQKFFLKLKKFKFSTKNKNNFSINSPKLLHDIIKNSHENEYNDDIEKNFQKIEYQEDNDNIREKNENFEESNNKNNIYNIFLENEINNKTNNDDNSLYIYNNSYNNINNDKIYNLHYQNNIENSDNNYNLNLQIMNKYNTDDNNYNNDINYNGDIKKQQLNMDEIINLLSPIKMSL